MIEAIWAGYKGGLGVGLWVGLFGPLSGIFAILFFEHRKEFFEEARTYFLFQTRDKLKQELDRRLALVTQQVAELVALHQKNP